jgi:hypothetical protein
VKKNFLGIVGIFFLVVRSKEAISLRRKPIPIWTLLIRWDTVMLWGKFSALDTLENALPLLLTSSEYPFTDALYTACSSKPLYVPVSGDKALYSHVGFGFWILYLPGCSRLQRHALTCSDKRKTSHPHLSKSTAFHNVHKRLKLLYLNFIWWCLKIPLFYRRHHCL